MYQMSIFNNNVETVVHYPSANQEDPHVNKLPLKVRSIEDIQYLLRNESKTIQGNETLAEDHRYTTLQNTLIDVLIAAHAHHFKPASFSSLSELVSTFSHIGKRDRGWCKHTTKPLIT